MGSSWRSSATRKTAMQHARTDQQSDDHRAAPSVGVALHQREHEQEERAGERDEADPVDAPALMGVARTPHVGQGDQDGDDPDRAR